MKMKVIYNALFLALILLVSSQCRKEAVPDSLYIPDNNFLNALIELGIDVDADGNISPIEAEAITYLDVSSRGIADMTGIEAFVNLDTLLCGVNQLTSLDVSRSPALAVLLCYANQLIFLDISDNTDLAYLHCGDNRLTSLDVSNNPDLARLRCGDNRLTELDVTNIPALKELSCLRNQLTMLDVSNNTSLELLLCNTNHLTGLDVSNNPALTELYCGENKRMNEKIGIRTPTTNL